MSKSRTKRRAQPAHLKDVSKAANERSMEANKSALRRIHARVIGETRQVPTAKALTTEPGASPTQSHVTGEDPLASLAQQGRTVEAPFDMLTLATLPEHSSELTQTIEAMETNIEATGHRFVPRVRITESTPDELRLKVKQEDVKLQNFFAYATREPFVEFRMRLRKDLESTGNCYFEVLRNTKGNVQGFTHMPSYQVRLGRMEDEPLLVDRKILELQVDGSVLVQTVKEWRRFRTYVQSRFISSKGLNSTVQGSKVRWFKEFGDPRNYDSRTGNLVPDDELADFPKSQLANEVIHKRLYSPRSPYGLPRYIGNLLSIFGDRAAEEINYTTFRNNNIPSMAVLVSNGQLTQGTVERIESFVESQIQGSDNYSKFLIIEGEPIEDEGEDGGQYKIELQPLTNNQIKDALFQNYSNNNQDKIRRAYRLPPIFVGRSDDYTRATAESSRRLADEQIFAPERLMWDEFMNRDLFPEMDIVYHKYKSNTPNTTDNTQLVKILAGAEKTGGMTPERATVMLEDILGQALPPFPEDFPADVPFSLTMAEAVKNMAPEPAEPGQNTTAIKALKSLGLIGDEPEGLSEDADEIMEAAEQLLKVRKRVDELWAARAELDEG